MRKPETNLQAKLLLAITPWLHKVGIRAVFMRNNNGVAVFYNKDGTERYVRYGLGNGTGDLIGWREIVITTEMVGKTIAQFTSWETKIPTDKATGQKAGTESNEQEEFRAAVNAAGGRAFVARTEDEVMTALSGELQR